MANNKEKKKIIFDLYSENLKWTKKKLDIKFQNEFDKGVMCPLCLDVFFENDLEVTNNNHLTLEHNPPYSLGGKANILTCKNCNNKSGHKTDVELLNYISEQEIKSFSPNSHSRVKLTDLKGNNISADLSLNQDREFHLHLLEKYSNPNKYRDFQASEEMELSPITEDGKYFTRKLEFEMDIQCKGDKRLASIALLKIGYLLGFEKYGHIFLFNQNLDIVREQILNPDKIIITLPFWINREYPQKNIGTNIIIKPKSLRCFLNIFVLQSKSQDLQVNILLPGYDNEDANIYENLDKMRLELKKGQKINAEMVSFEHLLNIRDENKALSSLEIWRRLKNVQKNIVE